MAKYKQPKNDKHKARKDLKDYTIDKEVEGMVPNASGEPLPEVPRKDDKEVIDDVENMVPKVKDSDRVYVTKDMEDGDSKMPSNALKQLERIKRLGGFEKIVPVEGIVFTYGGNTYKLTGAFAPINQILGTLKYSR